MLDTALDTYNTFLDGIKKTYTGTIKPSIFTRLINDWGIDEWLRHNVSENEGVDVTQKQVDDLQMLKVITDGSMTYNGDIMYPITPDTSNGYYFSKPDGITPINNLSASTKVYPKYLRKTGIKFKLTYVNNICNLTGISDYLKAQVMRDGQQEIIEDNYYLKPTDDNLYYKQINNKFNLITGTQSTGYCMRLEYLRYPRPFYFDTNRNVKSCITIDSNAIGVGTVQVTFTTSLGAYVSLVVNIANNDSKYVIAKNIYDSIINNHALPTSVTNFTTLNLNTICVGQYGYDGVATIVTTGVAIPYTIITGTNVSDVNIELPEQQRREVVESAVRIYLERVTDLRYKTYLTEATIRDSAKK